MPGGILWKGGGAEAWLALASGRPAMKRYGVLVPPLHP